MHIYNQPRRLTSANCKCEQRGSSELTVSQCTFNSGRWHFCRAIHLSKLPQSHATSLPATLHSVWMPPLLVSNSLGIVTAVHSPGKLFHSPTSGGQKAIANRVRDPQTSLEGGFMVHLRSLEGYFAGLQSRVVCRVIRSKYVCIRVANFDFLTSPNVKSG